jgi:RHS repeat-associated protein
LLSFVTGADVQDSAREIIFDQIVYGDSAAICLNPDQALQANLRGKPYKHYDAAGIATTEAYDFKGNLLRGRRQLVQDYKRTPDWSQSPPPALEAEAFASATSYDALNRPTQLIAPHGDQAGATINIMQPSYNEANLLERMHVWLRQTTEPIALLDPQSATLHAVVDIDYDAKGQRTRIEYGNGVLTEYAYDDDTFRLIHLNTSRSRARPPNPSRGLSGPAGSRSHSVVQDLFYTYDAAGNITRIRDDAQQAIFFNGQVVPPLCDYAYDPIYRLISATGREHIGQVRKPETTCYDESRIHLPDPNDGQAMRNYTEQYRYDPVGNLLALIHQAANGNWTRIHTNNEPSLIEPDKNSNRMTSTTVGDAVKTYTYDVHGNMTSMPHLTLMQWNFKDQLSASSRQAVNPNPPPCKVPETTFYVYDGGGQRMRKITERQNGSRKTELIYLGGFEIYREFDASGNAVAIERETLHVMDDKQRVALVETRTQGDDGSPEQLIRYQLSNHLGSACVELDDAAQIISYEEYFSYGSTSFQGVRSLTETPKRYRYVGMERDEESGLNYHGARYYAPWLARWISCDPVGVQDGLNLFLYCGGNPLNRLDRNGSEWCGITDGFFGLLDSDCHIAPEITRTAKRAAGGAVGAVKNFAGFVRLGAYDSWAQSFSSSSRQRILSAQASMGEMFDAIGDGRFVDYVGDGLAKRGQAIVDAENRGDQFGAGEVFGDTGMTVYFIGRGGVDAVRGGAGLVRSLQTEGAAATLQNIAYSARYWATEYEGIGFRATPSVSVNPARGAMNDNFPTFRATRVIARETAIAERALANGGAAGMRSTQVWQNSIGTRLEPANYGTAVNRIVDDAIGGNNNALGVRLQQPLGRNARGNPIKPDYQLSVSNRSSVIDITSPGQAGKALKYPASTVMEPLTGTSAPSISAPVYLPAALESPVSFEDYELTQKEINAQACFRR